MRRTPDRGAAVRDILTVNGLACDLLKVPRDCQVPEVIHRSRAGPLQVHAVTSSFVPSCIASSPGYADCFPKGW
ncbi:MAG: hypothetical protein M0Z41_00970 [Peptococcaceae bacterium]|nr:hypothetical protein [Peptococcaceae bacterium]